MSVKTNYNHTLAACNIGAATQAIVNNLAPLLFLTLQRTYQIPLDQITLLVTLNFTIQLLVDLASTKLVDRIGYRVCAVAAHVFAAIGIVGLGVFPDWFASPYGGLLVAVVLYAAGGGLLEVMISPMVEACPTERKSAAMSLLHSFYCWGQVAVVLLSTLFFVTAGMAHWRLLTLLWAIVPVANALYFLRVPIAHLSDHGETMKVRELLSMKLFWVFALLMMCAGASELAMSQWASAFAEAGLRVSKTMGDIAGPCFFAVLMGASRLFYSRFSEKIDLQRFMIVSGLLCIASYLLASFSPIPMLSLLGCGLCGLSVGIMWPGTYSIAAVKCPRGGTALFALLALAGDLGCSTGPTVVGFVSGALGDNLKGGLVTAVIFPILLLAGLFALTRKKKEQ